MNRKAARCSRRLYIVRWVGAQHHNGQPTHQQLIRSSHPTKRFPRILPTAEQGILTSIHKRYSEYTHNTALRRRIRVYRGDSLVKIGLG